MTPYVSMPSQEKWKRDSSVVLAVRSRDVVLTNIDDLIAQHERAQDDFRRLAVACALFFSLDYWLKVYRTEPTADKGRAPAVEALYRFVAESYLVPRFGCTINTLPRELELLFGRELSGHGRVMDSAQRCAVYMTRAQAEQYKMIFKQGKVYQYPWWQKPAQSTMALLNSKDAAADVHNDRRPEFRDFGFFVMSMSRDLYMTRHETAAGPRQDRKKNIVSLDQPGIYHSSYLAGVAVMSAGSMLIEGGVIRAIRADSGHYQPGNTQMVALLQTLQMHGVSIGAITVWDHDGDDDTPATLFFGDNSTWDQYQAQRQRTVKDNTDAAHELEIEKYMREHLVTRKVAKERLAMEVYSVKVGDQRVKVRQIKPMPAPAAPPRPVAAKPAPGASPRRGGFEIE